MSGSIDLDAIRAEYETWRIGHLNRIDGFRCCTGCRFTDHRAPALIAEIVRLRGELTALRATAALEA